MVQANQFYGKAYEEASAHLQHFLEICSSITIKGVTQDAVLLNLFPFSLLGKAKQWFYANKDNTDTREKCSNAFLSMFILMGKTNALRGRISSFQQQNDESIPEAWERFQEYISECPHHGMENWLHMQTFYHGLTHSAHENLDAAAGGAFMSLTVNNAIALIEKMVSNQGWSEERLHPCKKGGGMYTVKEVDMLSAKMDLLMKNFEGQAKEKQEVMQVRDSHMTCEVCGDIGHSGNNYPETQEDVNFINNSNYHPQ